MPDSIFVAFSFSFRVYCQLVDGHVRSVEAVGSRPTILTRLHFCSIGINSR